MTLDGRDFKWSHDNIYFSKKKKEEKDGFKVAVP